VGVHQIDEGEPAIVALAVVDEGPGPIDYRRRLRVCPLAAGEFGVGHRAEVDELRRQIAEVVVVVDGLPRAGQRPREHVAGENLEERVLVAEPVGEAGVGVIQALEE